MILRTSACFSNVDPEKAEAPQSSMHTASTLTRASGTAPATARAIAASIAAVAFGSPSKSALLTLVILKEPWKGISKPGRFWSGASAQFVGETEGDALGETLGMLEVGLCEGAPLGAPDGADGEADGERVDALGDAEGDMLGDAEG